VDRIHWRLSVTNLRKAPTRNTKHHQNMRSWIRTFQSPGRGGNMLNFISSFASSKSLRSVNEHHSSEDRSPHRCDCHDPPHKACVGLSDDRSPPRRLAAVARSDPRKAKRAQTGLPWDATRMRRLPRVAASDLCHNSRGTDCLRRDLHGEDCHPGQEIQSLAALSAAKIKLV
jgi:hypothetical protein